MFTLLLQITLLFANTQYYTQVDQDLDLKSVSLLPVTDNVNSIYSNPIENFLREQLKQNHHWDFSDQTSIGTILTPTELEENQGEVRRLCQSLNTNTLLSARLIKNAVNMQLQLSLFSCFDGRLFAKEENRNFTKFSTKDVLIEVKKLLDKVLNHIPFHGKVLSRNGVKVTLDLGSNDGIKAGETVNAVQIVQANRHPRFHFLVSTKKQVLGVIKIVKVDKTISFGVIESESSKNIIQRNSKIDALRYISYRTENAFNLYEVDEISSRDDAKLAFGEKPNQWKPVSPPTLGGVALKLGMGTYKYNIAKTGNNLNASSSFYPSIGVDGELWLTPEWTIEGSLRQGVVNVDNPLSGSSPSELSISTTKLDIRGLYNFLLYEDFFGPKLQLLGGFSNYITKVDASSPTSLTDTKYSGLHLGIKGSVPFGNKREYVGGAELVFYLTDSFSESPGSWGGSADSSLAAFKFFFNYYMNQNMQIVSDIQIDSLKTDFSGAGTNGTATGSDEKQTVLSGGIKFLW